MPDAPPRIKVSGVIMGSIFATFGVYSACTENWLGAAIDFTIVLGVFVFAYFHYKKIVDLERRIRIARTLHKLVNTPTMREEDNSIILTFIFPSPEIMEEIKALSKEEE